MKFKILSMIMICFIFFGAEAQIDRSKQPQSGPAPKINLAKPETFTLDNGIKVLVVENHKLPRVRASLIIDNKPHSEGSKVGIKSLYSSMMGNGTTTKTKDEFNERVDFLGANVGYGTNSAYASSLSKFFPEVFGLMVDGLINPRFEEEEFSKEKDRAIEGIKAEEKSASSIASNVSSYLAYGKNHPYGEFATKSSVEGITLNDVKNYYNTYITPKNTYLVVVGDIKENEVKDLANEILGQWKAGTPPVTTIPNVPAIQYTQINFIDVPNAVQSEVTVQNTVNLKMADEDYFPMLVTNQILGGSFGSYLNMNLREAHGYTYGARSYTGNDKYTASRFSAGASVRNAVTDSAIVETLKEIHRIKTEKVAFEDLNNAKNKFAGDFVLRLENPSTIANYALNIETEDLPKDFYQKFLQKINAVTQEDILRVANKYYKTDNMQIVVAGKGSEVVENLEKITYNGKKIPVLYFDKEGNKITKPEYNKAVPSDITVKTVYDNYIKAIGGKEAVEKVNTVSMNGSANVQGMTLSVIRKETNTGKSLDLVTMNGMTIQKDVFDGSKGYKEQQGQRMDYTAEEIKEAQEDSEIINELTVSENAKLVGIEKVDGEDAYVVQVDEETKKYYSVKTGLLVKTSTMIAVGPQTMENSTYLSDYKAVNNVKFPYTIKVSMGPQLIDIKMSEVKVNEGVTEEDFK